MVIVTIDSTLIQVALAFPLPIFAFWLSSKLLLLFTTSPPFCHYLQRFPHHYRKAEKATPTAMKPNKPFFSALTNTTLQSLLHLACVNFRVNFSAYIFFFYFMRFYSLWACSERGLRLILLIVELNCVGTNIILATICKIVCSWGGIALLLFHCDHVKLEFFRYPTELKW